MLEGHSKLVILFLLAGFLIGQKVSAATEHLVISQVQITAGTGRTSEDFVEIYNPTNESVDLEGYRLVKRTANNTIDISLKSWTASTIVLPGARYVWANSSLGDLSPAPDTMTSSTLANDNAVALRQGPENIGTLIDAVGWGTLANGLFESAPIAQNPEAGKSLQRSGDDTDNNAQDFIVANSIWRAGDDVDNEGLAPGVAASEPIVINNSSAPKTDAEIKAQAKEANLITSAIMRALKDIKEPVKPTTYKIFLSEIKPPLEKNGKGFIELENTGEVPIVLSDWVIKVAGKVAYRFDAKLGNSPTIGPNDFKIITKTSWVWPATAKVQLINSENKIIDEIQYSSATSDVTWVRFDEEWQWSNKNTPSKPNEVVAPPVVEVIVPPPPTPPPSGGGGIASVVAPAIVNSPPLMGGGEGEGKKPEDDTSKLAPDTTLSVSDIVDDLIGQQFILQGEVSRRAPYGFWLEENGEKVYVPYKDSAVAKDAKVRLAGVLKEKSGRWRFEPIGELAVEKSVVSKASKLSTTSESSNSVGHPGGSEATDRIHVDSIAPPLAGLQNDKNLPSPPQSAPWPKVAAGTIGLAALWRSLALLRR